VVDDFEFDIDASQYISPVCQGIYLLPDPKTGQIKSLRELCSEYVDAPTDLKELKLKKEIHWNYAELTRGTGKKGGQAVLGDNHFFSTHISDKT
jgi:hypothetical protein